MQNMRAGQFEVWKEAFCLFENIVDFMILDVNIVRVVPDNRFGRSDQVMVPPGKDIEWLALAGKSFQALATEPLGQLYHHVDALQADDTVRIGTVAAGQAVDPWPGRVHDHLREYRRASLSLRCALFERDGPG